MSLKIDSNYKGQLLFEYSDIENFRTYFKFKRSFFIPCKETDIDDMSAIILNRINTDLHKFQKFKISKNDIIYICKGTRNN